MIDILLATYNGERFVDKQLKSLLTQELSDPDQKIRLLIRDDGSADNTMSVINKRIEYYRRKREDRIDIKVLEDDIPTGSPAGNFMKLLAISSADYVMFSDQDDMWYRKKVEATYSLMKKKEAKYGKDVPILIHTDLSLMNDEGRKIADSFFDYQKLPKEDKLSTLLIQNTVTGCTMMLNRAAAELLKKAPVSEMVLLHDHYAAVMVAATGYVFLLDEALIRYRQHSGNVVGAHAADSREEYKNRFSLGRNKFLQDMDLSYRQAGYILKRYKDLIRKNHGEEYITMMTQYSELIMAGKIEKIEFFQKYGVYKNGSIKKAVQMLWC